MCRRHRAGLSAEPGAGRRERHRRGGAVLSERHTAHVTVIAETGSTNADVAALAGSGAGSGWEEGRWLRAERQTAGRGRMGRDWRSPEGNLQASTLIRLRAGDPPIAGLGLLVGLALHQAVAALVPHAGTCLKWPNDLMARTADSWAKLAGILLERSGEAIVVGVGVNVAEAPVLPDRATVALAELPGGQGIDAAAVLDALADRFTAWLGRWRQEGFAPVRAAWLSAAHPAGTPLSVGNGTDAQISGRFEGVAGDGALLLRLEDETVRLVHSGDVGLL